ncbi:MAG: hypothetical protein WCX71_03840 [Candidatus Buchananbacteria bacterium]
MIKKFLRFFVILALILVLVGAGWYYYKYLVNYHQSSSSVSNNNSLKKEKYLNLDLKPEIIDNILAKIDSLKKDLEQTPEDYNKILELGNVYKILGEFDLTKAEYEKAIKAWPDEGAAYYNLGDLYVLNYHDTTKGLENYLLAKEKSPANIDIYRSVADLYRSAMPDKVSQIETLMLDGAKKNPGNEVSFYEYLAGFYWQEKNYDKALRYNTILLKFDPKNQKFISDRDLILADQKKSLINGQ